MKLLLKCSATTNYNVFLLPISCRAFRVRNESRPSARRKDAKAPGLIAFCKIDEIQKRLFRNVAAKIFSEKLHHPWPVF